MKHIILLLPVVILFSVTCVKGQGCSDAGFCTINALKPDGPGLNAIDLYNQVKLGISNGRADHDINIWSGYLEYNRIINSWFSVDARLTYLAQNGPLASSSGLSDIYLNANYTGYKHIFFTAGLKLPLSNGNKTKDGLPLPMDYQTSLGTTDLVLGIGHQIGKLALALALQQPLSQNGNAFLSTDHPAASGFSGFYSTNKYIRKGDVLFRASYGVALGGKWKLTPGILPVYHLADDEFTDANGIKSKITGSKGLTFNGNMFLTYSFNRTNAVELNFGSPLAARDTRPDGLTRKYVITLEYRGRF